MLITSFVFRNSKFSVMKKMGELDYEKKFGHRFDPDKPRDEFPMTKSEFLSFFEPKTSKEIAKLI